MKKLILILFLSIPVFGSGGDVTEVVSGQSIELDGTSQKITFSKTNSFKVKLLKQGYVDVYVYIIAEDGCRVGNAPINDSVHGIYPTGIWVKISVTPDSQELYLKGQDTQEVIVTF